MSFDEYLQGIFETYFKFSRWRRKKKHARLLSLPSTVRLEDVADRLTLLARALSGEPVRIFPAEGGGGYKNSRFFFPSYFAAFDNRESNYEFYLYRLLFMLTQKELGHQYPPGYEVDDEQARTDSEKHAPEVLEKLFNDFPFTRLIHENLKSYFRQNPSTLPVSELLYGKWMTPPAENEKDSFTEKDALRESLKRQAESIKKAAAVEDIRVKRVDRKQQQDQVIHNYFEKIETIEEHTGGIWRDFDGSDELDEHENALEEVRMRNVIRTADETRSVYQTPFAENIDVPEADEDTMSGKFRLYDEWDYKRRSYKKDFCKLFPVWPEHTDRDYYVHTLKENRPVLNGLRKILANLRNRRLETRRQVEGPHFDIDALTDWFTDLKAGRTPSEKIYIAPRTPEKDVSLLLLLDVSMSTDGYVSGNRIIDIEKQSAILFGEILNEFQTDFAIHAFYSHTRNRSQFVNLKNFDMPWSQGAARIGAVQPAGYTRIGTALRHAGTLLEKRPAKDKWLILLSDGKPNDYDRYEGRYGMEDIKQALRELHVKNIRTYALAIEEQAKYYLPKMFGINRYQILRSPSELLRSLIKLYEIIKFES